jgi:hypothetical protein
MELIFNELSIYPISENKYLSNEKMQVFIGAIAEARKIGFRNVRSHHSANEILLNESYTVLDWLFDKNFPEISRNLLLGMLIQPFINEEDEAIETKYLEAEYFFEHTESNISKTSCLGLASAYLYETPAISFNSMPIWTGIKIDIIVEKEDEIEFQSVFNISSKKSFEVSEFAEFIENISILNLVATSLSIEDKNIHLADHHGKDELQFVCNQLKYNKYVEAMRSMEWCRGRCNDFIKKCHKTGEIEAVLFKTDRKYGLLIKTTGRNLKETKAISEILSELYS